jgi:hypothetical protein
MKSSSFRIFFSLPFPFREGKCQGDSPRVDGIDREIFGLAGRGTEGGKLSGLFFWEKRARLHPTPVGLG